MADNYLWDNGDVENPAPADSNIDSGSTNTQGEGNARSTSKAVKLGLILVAAVGAIALGAVLGLKSDGGAEASGLAPQAGSTANSLAQKSTSVVDGTAPNPVKVKKSTKDGYYTSPGPLGAHVKMVSPSIVNGYETCSDLEIDITEAIKLYMNDFINSEAVSNDMYEKCDPNNDNWWWDEFGYDDDYFYHDHYDADYICNPAANATTASCATDEMEVPWVLTWHEFDHAEGMIFYNKTEAMEAYKNVDASWAKRLYCPYKMKVEEYGWMGGSDWCQLETWAYEAQCSGEAPVKTVTKKATKSHLPKNQSHQRTSKTHKTIQPSSSIPRSQKPTRTRIPSEQLTKRVNTDGKRQSKNRQSVRDGFDQNSRHDTIDQADKVVSDGKNIYAAYGDILYAWPASDMTQGASITRMPGDVKNCDWNATEPCTSSSLPSIKALFLSKESKRLTVVVTQDYWENNVPANHTQPIITDYGTHVDVRVYDVSDVLVGSAVELGSKSLTGSFMSGGSYANKTIIATDTFVDTWVLTKELMRSEPQFCGLNASSYKDLALTTAQSKVSTMHEDSTDDELDLTGADFLLGRFVQVFSFDVSSDFGDGGIPINVAGAFTAGYGAGPDSIYMTEDFLAMPGHMYRWNATSGMSTYETFILGFNLSNNGAIPFSYAHLPGVLSTNYQMDKSGNQLRILTSDESSWPLYQHKIYVLELPSSQGQMSIVSESEDARGNQITASLFMGDKAYMSAEDSWSPEHKTQFVVMDLNQLNTIGGLELDVPMSYMKEIDLDGVSYILGIGNGYDPSTYESILALTLVDIRNGSPKLAAMYKEYRVSSESVYDFFSVRYVVESKRLIIPVQEYNATNLSYTDGFAVYDISQSAITRAFGVHSKDESYCWYDASIPPRSFIIHSELITIQEHTAMKSDMAGNLISELDLDVGLDYAECLDYHYYDYSYGYGYYDDDDDDLMGNNSTDV
eukprot:scaffold39038_cov78-Cyclotella_meneghiniana.AAC.4